MRLGGLLDNVNDPVEVIGFCDWLACKLDGNAGGDIIVIIWFRYALVSSVLLGPMLCFDLIWIKLFFAAKKRP